MTNQKRREPSCTHNHDAMRRELRDKELPSTPCPACGWLLSGMRERPFRGEVEVEPADDTIEVEALKIVVKELTAKIQCLVEWADEKGLLEEHAFTFPDGDVWKAQDIDV